MEASSIAAEASGEPSVVDTEFQMLLIEDEDEEEDDSEVGRLFEAGATERGSASASAIAASTAVNEAIPVLPDDIDVPDAPSNDDPPSKMVKK